MICEIEKKDGLILCVQNECMHSQPGAALSSVTFEAPLRPDLFSLNTLNSTACGHTPLDSLEAQHVS